MPIKVYEIAKSDDSLLIGISEESEKSNNSYYLLIQNVSNELELTLMKEVPNLDDIYGESE